MNFSNNLLQFNGFNIDFSIMLFFLFLKENKKTIRCVFILLILFHNKLVHLKLGIISLFLLCILENMKYNNSNWRELDKKFNNNFIDMDVENQFKKAINFYYFFFKIKFLYFVLCWVCINKAKEFRINKSIIFNKYL